MFPVIPFIHWHGNKPLEFYREIGNGCHFWGLFSKKWDFGAASFRKRRGLTLGKGMGLTGGCFSLFPALQLLENTESREGKWMFAVNKG